MKILFVVGEFPKLSQTFILNQVTGLIDAGHDVKILAKQSAIDQKVHEAVRHYHLQERVIYYGKPGRRGKLNKMLQFISGFAALSLVRLIRRNPDRSVPRFRDLRQHPNLILISLRLHQVDLSDREIILAHFGPNGILAQKCMELGLLRGKLFVAFHGYDMLRYVKQKGRAVYHELFHSPAILLPISNYWKEQCIKLGASPSKIIVHHMGIDMETFRAEPEVLKRPLRIVSAARLVEKKGLAFAIDAIALLNAKGYSIHYSIAGEGPLAAELREQIFSKGLQRSVELLGWCTQQEWIAQMKEAHVVLAPSVMAKGGDMEGIPVQLMEAMAMRRIVLATRHSGIPELIEDGYNGFLVGERDAAALAAVIETIIHSSEQWPLLAEHARQTVAHDFNIERQNQRLIRIFKGETVDE
ncbi:MAG: glycosyltransferase [Sporolactobacillus sp.]